MQEYTSQLQMGIGNPDPRKQILSDLEEQFEELQRNPNHYIVIMMDANESMRKNG